MSFGECYELRFLKPNLRRVLTIVFIIIIIIIIINMIIYIFARHLLYISLL